MADKFDQLLSIVTADENMALRVMHNACVETLKTYNSTRTADALKNWKAADAGKALRVEQLWAKYNQEAPAFKDVSAVAKHLIEKGYDVGKSSVYKAVKDGLLQKEPDGRVLELAVRAYAAGLRKKNPAADPAEKTGEKITEEVRKVRLQADALQFDLDLKRKKYLPMDDLEIEVIERAAVLESGLRFKFSALAADIIELVKGDRNREPDLIELVNGWLDTALNEFARTESFRVSMLASGDDPDTDEEEEFLEEAVG